MMQYKYSIYYYCIIGNYYHTFCLRFLIQCDAPAYIQACTITDANKTTKSLQLLFRQSLITMTALHICIRPCFVCLLSAEEDHLSVWRPVYTKIESVLFFTFPELPPDVLYYDSIQCERNASCPAYLWLVNQERICHCLVNQS